MTEEIAVREINSDARPALKDREIDEKTLESQYSEVWQRKLEVENDAPPKLMVDSLSVELQGYDCMTVCWLIAHGRRLIARTPLGKAAGLLRDGHLIRGVEVL